jgi:hypothetical protein
MAKEKELTLEEVLAFCGKAEKPALLQINSTVLKLLSGSTKRERTSDAIVISRDGKPMTIEGRPGTLARRIAGLLFGKGINDESLNPALAFCGRQSAAFTKKKEFDKVVNAIRSHGFKVDKYPSTIKD